MGYWIALLIPALVMAVNLWIVSVNADEGGDRAPRPPVEVEDVR